MSKTCFALPTYKHNAAGPLNHERPSCIFLRFKIKCHLSIISNLAFERFHNRKVQQNGVWQMVYAHLSDQGRTGLC